MFTNIQFRTTELHYTQPNKNSYFFKLPTLLEVNLQEAYVRDKVCSTQTFNEIWGLKFKYGDQLFWLRFFVGQGGSSNSPEKHRDITSKYFTIASIRVIYNFLIAHCAIIPRHKILATGRIVKNNE